MVTRTFILGAAAIAAGAFFAPIPGMPAVVGVASAAPVGPHAGLEGDGAIVTLANDGVGPAVGGIILGLAYCGVQDKRCGDAYGKASEGYEQCMGDAGCGSDEADYGDGGGDYDDDDGY